LRSPNLNLCGGTDLKATHQRCRRVRSPAEFPYPKGGLVRSVRYFRGTCLFITSSFAYETTQEYIVLVADLIRLSRLIEIEKKVKQMEMQTVPGLQKLSIP
jgi:hypothetical protein